MAAVQAGITFDQVQAQPAYAQLNDAKAYEVAADFFAKHVASQPQFQQLAPQQQQEVQQDFYFKYQVQPPELSHLQAPDRPSVTRGMVRPPQWEDYNPNTPAQIGKDLLGATLSAGTGAVKGLTLGYADFTDDARKAAEFYGAKYYDPEIAELGGDAAGMALPFEAGANLGMRGLQAAGRNLLPRTTPLAQSIGRGANWQRSAMGMISRLQSKRLAAQSARMAASVAAYEGLSSHPGHQLDVGERLKSAAIGGAFGAALPPALHGANKALKGTIRAFQPARSAAIKLGERRGAKLLGTYENTFKDLDALLNDVYDGKAELPPEQLNELLETYNSLKIFLQGKGPITRRSKLVKAKATLQKRRNAAKAEAVKAETTKIAEQPKSSNTELSEPDAIPAQGKVVKTTAALSGRVQKKVDELAESVGMKVDGLVNARPKDLTPEQADVRTNIKAVLDAQVNAQGELLQKLPQSHLSYSEAADIVADDKQAGKLLEKLQDAIEQDALVSAEYVGEIVGRSNKAIKLTKTGNIKPARTKLTPLGFKKATKITNPEQIPVNPKTGKQYGKDTKKVQALVDDGILEQQDFLMVEGYNEQGHLASYYVSKSPEGSHIKLVTNSKPGEGFRGEYANPAMGERTFKADDVLGRGMRSEDGFIKTSKAKEIMTEAVDNLDKVFSLIDDPKTPPEVKKVLAELRDAPTWGNKELKKLNFWLNKKEFKTVLCEVLGLTHG